MATDLPTLSLDQLNRATLSRQLLLERSTLAPVKAVERIAGLQAQEPASPYVALWTRLVDFDPTALDRAIARRSLVKATLMRVTVHLVSARDYPSLLAALTPMVTAKWPRARFPGVTVERIDALRDAAIRFASEPRSLTELRDHLVALDPDISEEAAFWRIRRQVPFVHVPGDAPWAYGRRPSLVVAGSWLRPSGNGTWSLPDEAGATVTLVRRYLAAFGPATMADISQWSGLPVAALRPAGEAIDDLVRYRDERGRTLIDLPGLAIPDADVPAPVRFLAMWDSTLLAHTDRRRIISDAHRKVVIAANGDTLPTFLVDGRVAGLWWAARDASGRTRIELDPFGRLSRATRRELEVEAERLAAFLEPREPEAYRRYQRWRQAVPR